jgi:hypothetical protein
MKRAIAILSISAAAFAQGTRTRITGGGGSASADGARWSATANIGPPPAYLPNLTGAPYSGVEVREHVRVNADGSTTRSRGAEQRIYRDSQGRTRVEFPISMALASHAASVPAIVEISDPVAGRVCDLDTQSRVAHCSEARAAPQPQGSGIGPAGQRAGAGPIQGQERQTIDGVETVLTTSAQLTGVNQGYDRNFTVVTQRWYSPELRIVMMEKTSDPRTGESTFRFENFSRAEPPFDLFQVPADYTLKLETGPFTISYSKP